MRNPLPIVKTVSYNIYNYEYQVLLKLTPYDRTESTVGQQLPRRVQATPSLHITLDIWTDGSRQIKSKLVGSAYVGPILGFKDTMSFNRNSSILTAECAAINKAMDLALENSNRSIRIFSDSLTA
ncbi:hypothetical protein QAD02_004937 [Eretmocerus hayati]|uniref:Uncharacterized protein n=1 Tax=Eretmocerus hayati TaxID=131215 RepID=A0ACC2NQY2_9HYME|nr:hypothetical protein QAD02_004937 [Eretmocerus hayati]